MESCRAHPVVGVCDPSGLVDAEKTSKLGTEVGRPIYSASLEYVP